jgi:hypothetical protein
MHPLDHAGTGNAVIARSATLKIADILMIVPAVREIYA